MLNQAESTPLRLYNSDVQGVPFELSRLSSKVKATHFVLVPYCGSHHSPLNDMPVRCWSTPDTTCLGLDCRPRPLMAHHPQWIGSPAVPDTSNLRSTTRPAPCSEDVPDLYGAQMVRGSVRHPPRPSIYLGRPIVLFWVISCADHRQPSRPSRLRRLRLIAMFNQPINCETPSPLNPNHLKQPTPPQSSKQILRFPQGSPRLKPPLPTPFSSWTFISGLPSSVRVFQIPTAGDRCWLCWCCPPLLSPNPHAPVPSHRWRPRQRRPLGGRGARPGGAPHTWRWSSSCRGAVDAVSGGGGGGESLEGAKKWEMGWSMDDIIIWIPVRISYIKW